MDTYPVTARSLGLFFRTDGDTLERAYKEHLSGFMEWKDRSHADQYLLFEENFGPHMSIDETSTKDGELFTILSNKDGHGRKGSIAAIVRGTRQEDVVRALELVPEMVRKKVGVITMDFSSCMQAICERAFPWADRVLDRFHMQRMAIDAVSDLRLKHQRDAMAEETSARLKFKAEQQKRLNKIKRYKMYQDGSTPLPRMKSYAPPRLANGDTLPELLTRSRYLLTMSADKWTDTQKARAQLLFSIFPDMKEIYGLSHGLRVIFSNRKATRQSAKTSLDEWYKKAHRSRNKDMALLADMLLSREDEVLNYFDYRLTNASAEALNTKIKAFRAQLRGVLDLKFFLFRLTRIYA